MSRTRLSCASMLLLLLGVARPVAAQDLEPKAYAASPVGATFVVVGYSRSTGSVLTDPTAPVQDVRAVIDATPVAVGQTFGLFGKLALVTAALPYSWGTITGRVFEQAGRVTRSGLVDGRLKLSVNLVGNPAMSARAFARSPRRVIFGTSLTVATPTGQYDGRKLINLGTNRWAFKPEVGVSVPRGRWDFDAYAGTWLFAANPDYFPGGQRRSQDAIVAVQGHASYTIRPKLWVAFDATWYAGGDAHVAGGPSSAGVNNSRAGVTLSAPIGRRFSFKVAYSNGVSVRTGTDFRTLSAGFQWLHLPVR